MTANMNDIGMKEEIKKLKSLRKKINSQIQSDDNILIDELVDKLQKQQLQLELQNSELKEAQSLLEYSRDEHADFYDFAPIGLITLDEKGVIKNVNEAASDLLHRNKKQLFGLPFTVFFKNDEKIKFFKYLKSCKNNGKASAEFQVKFKDQKNIYIKITCHRSLDYLSKSTIFRCAISEITEQKKIRDKIKELAAIVSTSNDAIYTISPDEKIISWNESAEALFGYKKDEIIGKAHSILVPEKLKDETKKIHNNIKNGEKIKHFETIRVTKNGKRIDISKSMSPIKNDDEKIIGISAIARNITEKKFKEEALRESNERFRQLAENINSVFFIINPEGSHVIYMSPAYEGVWGKPVESVYKDPKSWMKSIHPEDLEKVNKVLDQRFLSGESQVQYRIFRNKNDMRWIYSRTFPVKDSSGNTYRIAGIAEDITDFKNTENKLNASVDEKEILLKETNHRVKNNLQLVISLLNLQANSLKDETLKRVFDESKERIHSIALIHEKLYKSKNLSQLNFEVYIKTLSSSLLVSYSSENQKINLVLEIKKIFLSPDVAINLGLIINELISNSLKYAFSKNEKGEIRIDLSYKSKKEFLLKYSDDGIGFPENIDFKNTESLGMQLVNALTVQIQGEINMENKKGTTFYITFPAESRKN